MQKLNVIYCGTPDFGVPTLELLHNNPHICLKAVITMPDRPVGRGQHLRPPPIAEFAKNNKIPLIQTENINKEEQIVKKLEGQNIDLIIVLAFAQFLGQKILNLPRLGCFNIHTSLLPKYRGAAPIQYALLNGDKNTGVSIQRMVKKMDAGDIVFSKGVNVSKSETGGQLYTRLKFEAALSCNEFIDLVLDNNLQFSTQDESKVCYAPTLKKVDGLIDFSQLSQVQVINKVRALDPWPGTYCFLGKKRLKIYEVAPDSSPLRPGQVSTKFNTLLVGCKDSSLRLQTVQIEGKKIGSDTELLNGLKGHLQDFDEELVINSQLKSEK
ncbi:MAG: methionyl-tRNA formyltransferase [Bacteriovoracaceae bacterium]|nr:methionyl-tRNA formyltransferase [Bacteriovoracaceae bacterium]